MNLCPCGRPVKAHGLCDSHLARVQRTGSPSFDRPLRPRGDRTAICPCGRPAIARGWCWTHHRRWKKTGDPQLDVPVGRSRYAPAPLADRLIAKVSCGQRRADGTRCLLWAGSRNRDGYGSIGVGQGSRKVHRVAYELWVGPIPEGLHIDHLCRVRNCVNPAHLEAVTQAENNRRGVRTPRVRCRNGHPDPVPGKRCRQCAAAYRQRVRARKANQ